MNNAPSPSAPPPPTFYCWDPLLLCRPILPSFNLSVRRPQRSGVLAPVAKKRSPPHRRRHRPLGLTTTRYAYWKQHPTFHRHTPACLRFDADAPLGATHVRHHHLLPLRNSTNGSSARTFPLVDWHGRLRSLVDPPLPQIPGAHNSKPNDPLTYPFPIPAQQLRYHRPRRLLRPNTTHPARQPLHLHFHWPVQAPRRHVRSHSSAFHYSVHGQLHEPTMQHGEPGRGKWGHVRGMSRIEHSPRICIHLSQTFHHMTYELMT